ncbi:MAG: DUF1007 family protein [Hyphomicrobiales bacterium]|nr:DUF1007 family protein [Hyphomicrobiales bacterium]
MHVIRNTAHIAPWLSAALLFLFAALYAYPVQAHPHVWVKVRSAYVFTPEGKIAGVRHAWTFDGMYSAFAIQGLGKDGVPVEKGLQALARVNVAQLKEYGYFTVLRVGGRKLTFSGAKDQSIILDKKKVMTLSFTLMLKTPVAAKPAAVLKVVDPSYFVAFDFDKGEAVRLAGAPEGCSISMMRPRPLTVAQQKRLEAVQGTNESPGEGFGIFLATSAIAACP